MLNINFQRRPFLGLFLLLQISVLISENDHRPIISAIEIRGNIKTQDYILRREVLHPLDGPIDSVLIIEDRNRLDNLGLFSESSWQTVPLEDGTRKLVYLVTESIHRTPPLALPTYNEDAGWSLAGLWLINNFRGKNQSLALGGSIGGEDTYGFNFTDPWMFGDHVSLTLNLGRTLYEHRFLNRTLDVNSLYVGFGKWYGSSIKTSLGFELETKSFFKESNNDSFFYLGLTGILKYDTRDIFWNPGRGVLFSQSIYHREGFKPEDWRITTWTQSFSWYKRINEIGKKRVIAFNASFTNKMGAKDDLWLDYFGNSSTIRGWPLPGSDLYFSNKESFRFGHQSALFSFEIRQEVIPKYATSFGTEFGLALVMFSDVGMIADNWSAINKEIPMSGFGMGIRIPLPLVGVLRVDYGWGYRNGTWNAGALHWGIGQKF